MTKTIFRNPLLVRSIPWSLALWTLIILYLTTVPSDQLADVSLFKYDKLGHFIIIGGWTFLVGLIQLVYLSRIERPLFPIALAGFLFGAFIEVLQFVLPIGRQASWADIAANTLGCLLAYIALVVIRRILRQTPP